MRGSAANIFIWIGAGASTLFNIPRDPNIPGDPMTGGLHGPRGRTRHLYAHGVLQMNATENSDEITTGAVYRGRHGVLELLQVPPGRALHLLHSCSIHVHGRRFCVGQNGFESLRVDLETLGLHCILVVLCLLRWKACVASDT